MAQFHERRALVEREEVPRPVAELFGDVAGIVRECVGGVAGFPPAAILQRLRQVPVIERRERRNVVGDEVVQEPVVEVEAFGIWRAARGFRANMWGTASPGLAGNLSPGVFRLLQQNWHEREVLSRAANVG